MFASRRRLGLVTGWRLKPQSQELDAPRDDLR
jgi:hypothetical protein